MGPIRGSSRSPQILEGNPLDDIHNVRGVRWTVSNGRMFDAAAWWTSVRFVP
jgi:hypothetical protein